MKILVTGGTGRIGANLVKRLLDRGHDIRSFVYPGDSSRADKLDTYDRVETVVGDLRNFDDVKKRLMGLTQSITLQLRLAVHLITCSI